MTIPYGALVTAGGLVSLFFGASTAGMQVAGAGAVVAASSICSLKSWKAGGTSTLFTLASAGSAAWVAYNMWQRIQLGLSPVVVSGILLALSGALALFCVYNVIAGGNPPPKGAKA